MTPEEWVANELAHNPGRRDLAGAVARYAGTMSKRRARRFLRRAEALLQQPFQGPTDPGGPDGGAGVREPRRPLPGRPSASMALPLEDDSAVV